ncbi:MAG: response regulator [Desulfobacter sp.]|nr:MAG: response regulator [Desulfobacter sp.]
MYQTLIIFCNRTVVDDDSGIRNFTVNALTYCVNRKVLSFPDGAAAWDYIAEGGEVDIVISDVDMPEMNGFELLEKIKAKWADKIFILMSGQETHAQKSETLGADAFLDKPFSINDLFKIVQFYVVD